ISSARVKNHHRTQIARLCRTQFQAHCVQPRLALLTSIAPGHGALAVFVVSMLWLLFSRQVHPGWQEPFGSEHKVDTVGHKPADDEQLAEGEAAHSQYLFVFTA